jgi:hypothetical protein
MSDDKGSYEITAKVHDIPPATTRDGKDGKTYTDRNLILLVAPGKYEQTVAFEVRDKQAPDLAALRVGDTVTVSFNLRGRAWKDPKTGVTKYFNSNQAWKIELAAGEARGPVASAGAAPDLDRLPF